MGMNIPAIGDGEYLGAAAEQHSLTGSTLILTEHSQ